VAAAEFEGVNERLAEVSAHCSERERRAEAAERGSLLWKKIVFMKERIGRDFDAFVTGVAGFGVFVTLQDFFVEGLIPISALGNDFFVYEEKQHRLRGRSGGKIYRLGDPVRVRLVEIDEIRRRLNFRLAETAAAPASRRRTRTAAAAPEPRWGRGARRSRR
jgi:ribonuclease R